MLKTIKLPSDLKNLNKGMLPGKNYMDLSETEDETGVCADNKRPAPRLGHRSQDPYRQENTQTH